MDRDLLKKTCVIFAFINDVHPPQVVMDYAVCIIQSPRDLYYPNIAKVALAFDKAVKESVIDQDTFRVFEKLKTELRRSNIIDW